MTTLQAPSEEEGDGRCLLLNPLPFLRFFLSSCLGSDFDCFVLGKRRKQLCAFNHLQFLSFGRHQTEPEKSTRDC